MTGLITQRPVSDVLKRLREENITAIATDNMSCHWRRHFSLHSMVRPNRNFEVQGYELGEQFTQLQHYDILLSLLLADNCIATVHHGPMLVKIYWKLMVKYCEEFRNVSNFFGYHFPSSSIVAADVDVADEWNDHQRQHQSQRPAIHQQQTI